ncbi:MAG: glycosyltransferase, partial [Candidatus Planktophila sp.]|nr:glycosyltransferase [Candidatus Planktophila sp.]
MVFSIFILNTVLLALSLLNFLTIRKPEAAEAIAESVVVLLPMRNEAGNAARVISELASQENLSNFTLVVIDDNSEDETLSIAQSLQSQQIAIVQAPLPPAGWIGKVNALQAGLESKYAQGADFIISVDADVSFEKNSIARAVATLKRHNLDFISPYPRQIALTWSERLIQPLLQWSWMSTLLLRGAEKFPMKSTVVCNGQFLAMRADSLRSIGGFTAVATHVLDDIELGRAFVEGGFKGAVIDGSSIASTRMYSSFNELRAGYGKSLNRAFGSLTGSIVAAIFMIATGVLPLLFALAGDLLAIAALSAIMASRLISAISSGSRIRDSFLHSAS